jgi:lipooligosaccharide transport system permease protein
MLTTLLAARLRHGDVISPDRIASVIQRNVGALRSGPPYYLMVVSGFFEPLLYLLSIGVGVGALIGDLTLPDGRTLSYERFVAPAMLAVSAMSGALAETTFTFFFKLKYLKTFEAVLATPVRPLEVAAGELIWAVLRCSLYTGAFLAVMVALDLTTAGRALAAFPATLLVGIAFGAAGMAVSTLLRGWQDFDLLTTGQFALFLFSGTFSPIQDYPPLIRLLIDLTPLYHAVELVRGLTIGHPSWDLFGHGAYLTAMTGVALLVAGRRLSKALCV